MCKECSLLHAMYYDGDKCRKCGGELKIVHLYFDDERKEGGNSAHPN